MVLSWSGGRITWPVCHRPSHKYGSALLVDKEQMRASRPGSACAAAYWFGVTKATACNWREAFGVTPTNNPVAYRLQPEASRLGPRRNGPGELDFLIPDDAFEVLVEKVDACHIDANPL